MTNKEVLVDFFKAENERKWSLYELYLHPEVVWQLFTNEEKKMIGIENYMQVIKNANKNTDAQFFCINMQISSDGNRIVTYLVNNSGGTFIGYF